MKFDTCFHGALRRYLTKIRKNTSWGIFFNHVFKSWIKITLATQIHDKIYLVYFKISVILIQNAPYYFYLKGESRY